MVSHEGQLLRRTAAASGTGYLSLNIYTGEQIDHEGSLFKISLMEQHTVLAIL